MLTHGPVFGAYRIIVARSVSEGRLLCFPRLRFGLVQDRRSCGSARVVHGRIATRSVSEDGQGTYPRLRFGFRLRATGFPSRRGSVGHQLRGEDPHRTGQPHQLLGGHIDFLDRLDGNEDQPSRHRQRGGRHEDEMIIPAAEPIEPPSSAAGRACRPHVPGRRCRDHAHGGQLALVPFLEHVHQLRPCCRRFSRWDSTHHGVGGGSIRCRATSSSAGPTSRCRPAPAPETEGPAGTSR